MKKTLAAAGAVAMLSVPALADNTDQAVLGVSGTLIEALEIASVTDIVMPAVVVPVADSETDNIAEIATTGVTLSCDKAGAESVIYTAGSNPFAAGDASATLVGNGTTNDSANARDQFGLTSPDVTGVCGEINVTGEESLAYAIDIAIQNPTDNGVTLEEVRCRGGANFTQPVSGGNAQSQAHTGVLSGGDDTLFCGATISVGTGANDSLEYDNLAALVTVTYN